VPDITGGKATSLDLADGGVLFAQFDAIGPAKQWAEPLRVPDIREPEPGIDQNQPRFGLDQQAMADDRGGLQDRAEPVP
jgi:hypothetical protein